MPDFLDAVPFTHCSHPPRYLNARVPTQVSADNFAPEDLKYKFLELPLVSQTDFKGESLAQQNAEAAAVLQAKFNKYQPDIAGWVVPLHVRVCCQISYLA